ncbi:MAG: peptide chain release factor N(5)-glutamine methyltransferase [Clostridiales bacterium]|jgi:release factor glutamine methyltransferase|nr:peptide chain release factor N(5)-glutamine methyltransferase [Clostridiales bacterium]
MNIKQALTEGIEKLNRFKISTCVLDAQVILSFVLGKDRLFLLTNPLYNITNEQHQHYSSLIMRRADDEPVAYIIGEKEFMGLKFNVDKSTLIPRPDTEVLVETTLNFCSSGTDVLELGTGSGVIAICLAHYGKFLQVDALDINTDAIKMAQKNADANNVVVNFLHGDVFDFIPDKDYDIIVSNPPYIPTHIIDTLAPTVKNYEPHLALNGGADGLDFYRLIAERGSSWLKPKGKIVLEIGYDQLNSVTELFSSNDYNVICTNKDINDISRVIAVSHSH